MWGMTSRKRQTQQATDPRVVGGTYRSGYWGDTYEVLSIQWDERGWLVNVIVRDEHGVQRGHCTAWDARRDEVISQPSHGGK